MGIIKSSQELINLINKSSSVFLMGHKDLDLDAINGCLGLDFYLRSIKKKSYVIIDDNKNELAVKKVLDRYCEKVKIIKSKEVENLKDQNSLLIVIDTNKIKLLQNPEMLNLFSEIVNIDHHDKSDESLDATLPIFDLQASSACEMITMFFKENEIKMDKKIATLLLSGIILDTNYYHQKADSDTFYLTYYLTRCGAEVSLVNELLKQDLKDYIKRQKLISSVKVINSVAISKGSQRTIYKKEDLAKSASNLMTFHRIKAAFVIAKTDSETIRISARSNGTINVGKILEYFEGGGNDTEAGAKIENSNINKVFDELSKIIKKHIGE